MAGGAHRHSWADTCPLGCSAASEADAADSLASSGPGSLGPTMDRDWSEIMHCIEAGHTPAHAQLQQLTISAATLTSQLHILFNLLEFLQSGQPALPEIHWLESPCHVQALRWHPC